MMHTSNHAKYLSDLTKRALDSFDRIHRGITSLALADFPDYANVGDSAITLGQSAFWVRSNIKLSGVYTAQSFELALASATDTVAINGGGNFGGLYPESSRSRYGLAEHLASSTTLIQEPQSIHFSATQDEDRFLQTMATRPNTRIAVRDHQSLQLMTSAGVDAVLSPDACHLLGALHVPQPRRRTLILARTDTETSERIHSLRTMDWPSDRLDLRVTAALTRRLHPAGLLRSTDLPPRYWIQRAQRRFNRGLALLSAGEIIVTNRLHAMLIALQAGRRVVFADNNNGKLSSYYNTWLRPYPNIVRSAPTLVDALVEAERW